MMRLSAELRAHPDWWLLYEHEETKKRWMEDAMGKTWSVGPASNNIRMGLGRHQVRW